jgi:predicted AAA+ superfamily ATPase
MGLQKIFDYLDQGNIEYVCNAGGWCANGKTAAWVDPITAPGRINLCASFWQPDQAPWYTKVIAITHELAHFHTNWLDEGYREAALALAKNQPDRARRNAENYALYTVDSEIPCVASIESCN